MSDTKQQLLVENSLFEYKSEKRNDHMILTGLLTRADSKNFNGRIYPKSILEREMKNYQVLVNERRALGQLDHPTSSLVELSDVSHLVTKIWWNGNEVFGELELLNTPKGKIAQELINNNVKVGISSRAVGSLKEESSGSSMVQGDLQWICWDLVSEASCQGAYLALKESFDPNSIKVVNEGKIELLFSKEYRVNRILNKLICGCADSCKI